MYSYKLRRLPKSTVSIIFSIPWADIKLEENKAFDLLHQNLELEGFRKGKVPRELAIKHIKKEDIYNELVRSLIPRLYEDVVSKENLKPIISPKITLKKAKENEDWEIEFLAAEKPLVELGNYQEIIKKVKAEAKKTDIWIPGKDVAKNEQQEQEKQKQKLLQEILQALLTHVKAEISDLVVEEELNQRLSNLVDELQKLGLTVDAYLRSKGVTMEQLREQYKREITDTYRLEFILQEIADKEGIKVESTDLDKLFNNIKDEKEKQLAQKQAYLYASILRKQKTLDYINNL